MGRGGGVSSNIFGQEWLGGLRERKYEILREVMAEKGSGNEGGWHNADVKN